MEKYHEENGMQRILRELSSLLEDTSIGTVSDRALLLDYKATLERNIGKAVKLETPTSSQIYMEIWVDYITSREIPNWQNRLWSRESAY